MRGGTPEAARLRAPRLVVAAAVLGATLPIVWAGIGAARSGWMPVWDNAYPALRAADVFSRHPPLLGTRSSASQFGGRTINHPGPLEFVFLAPWVRLFGVGAGTALGVAFLNASSVATSAWLAFRRAGATGAVVAMAAMATLVWSMGSSMLIDPWPPHVTLFPFALALGAAWSVADGDAVALPVLALSTSFVLQTHLGYTLLAPGLVVVSLGLFGWRRFRERSTRCWAVGAAATALVCWSAPIYEQVSRPGGNLRALAETAGTTGTGTKTLSIDTASGFFARTVVLPPWWLPPSFESAATRTSSSGLPTALALTLIFVFGLGILAATLRAHRHGHRTVAAGLILILATTPLVLATLTQIPTHHLMPVQPGYVRFLWPYAAFVGMVVVSSVRADEVWARATAGRWLGRRGPALVAAGAVLAGLLALPTRDHARTTGAAEQTTRELAAQVLPELDPDQPVLVQYFPSMSAATWIGPGLLAELHAAGIPFVVSDPDLEAQLGSHRLRRRGQEMARLVIVGDDHTTLWSPTAELVAEMDDPVVRIFIVPM